jgi:hypothetical protein
LTTSDERPATNDDQLHLKRESENIEKAEAMEEFTWRTMAMIC